MGQLLKTMKLADLLYGHPGRFIQRLGKHYFPKLAVKQGIWLGELDCGCWMVLDGNNRTGLLIRANPEATVADYPQSALLISSKGTWDTELDDWWNPCPKTFEEAMRVQTRTAKIKSKQIYYGFVERIEPGQFYGLITSDFRDKTIDAKADSPAKVGTRLRSALVRRLDRLGKATDFDIKLTGDTEPEHQCRRNHGEKVEDFNTQPVDHMNFGDRYPSA
jgi:hypothetical protein